MLKCQLIVDSLFDSESSATIPFRILRVWLGRDPIPRLFEGWWDDFRRLHPTYDCRTVRDVQAEALMPASLADVYADCDTQAGRSDVARIVALQAFGGVYVDVDVMPLRPLDDLLSDGRPFACKRSSRSFESAVFGGPAGHTAFRALVDALPEWYAQHAGRSASVRTGPGFLSSVWFGRLDVRHLPSHCFYPFNGFMAPSRDEKLKMFLERKFHPKMYAAHFSNHRWGGSPK